MAAVSKTVRSQPGSAGVRFVSARTGIACSIAGQRSTVASIASFRIVPTFEYPLLAAITTETPWIYWISRRLRLHLLFQDALLGCRIGSVGKHTLVVQLCQLVQL